MSKTHINKEVKVDKSTYEVEIKRDKHSKGKSTDQELIETINYFIKRNLKSAQATNHDNLAV